MNFNISFPGLEEFRFKKTIGNGGIFQLHVELDAKPHRCPACNTLTQKVHDYDRFRMRVLLHHQYKNINGRVA